MTNEQIIREAISRSISHDEMVHCRIEAEDTCEIHHLVDSAQTGDWDYVEGTLDEDGLEVLDVYSCASARQSWRISVTFAGAN